MKIVEKIFLYCLYCFLALNLFNLNAQNIKKVTFTENTRSFNFSNLETPVFAYAIPDYVPDAYDLIYKKIDDENYSITLRDNFVLPPEPPKPTCEYYKVTNDGSIECVGFEDTQNQKVRNIIFESEGQEEIINRNEFIKISYSKIDQLYYYFSYLTMDNGYKLKLVKKGNTTSLKLDKLCQRNYFDDLKFINISVDYNLRYEQIIITPGVDSAPWEIRIGTVQDRSCSSPNLSKLKKYQNLPEYLKNIPR
jgi:hypothetical protein